MIFTVYITSVYCITASKGLEQNKNVPAQNIMYTSLFSTVLADSLFPPMRTVYVVSESQLEQIKRKQRQEELENLEASRKRLEETYQSRIKIIDEREHELQEELKGLAQAEKKTELSAEKAQTSTDKA
ncbi:hypothetical protein [Prochlorococcus sp. MIT 1300]|uniref:hypothetical protein n=1 Tax=Prochlorococcus sp. MIT 1300 TaxID=3096218 RepID=UPI002A74B9EB|nr:hypothetical protein [Prochlorococcus sp. MIT 1300]